MAVAVLWTQRVLKHLETELEYYGNIHQKLAKEMSLIISESTEKIMHMPTIGRAGKYIGTREFVVSKYLYIMVYRVRNDVLEVLALVHIKKEKISKVFIDVLASGLSFEQVLSSVV